MSGVKLSRLCFAGALIYFEKEILRYKEIFNYLHQPFCVRYFVDLIGVLLYLLFVQLVKLLQLYA